MLDIVQNYWTQFKKFGPISENSLPLVLVCQAGYGPECNHRRPHESFPGRATLIFCLSFSGCWPCSANERSQNAHALPFLHHKELAPCYGKSHKNYASLEQQCFFWHSIKLHGLPLSVVTVSLQNLSKMSAFNALICSKTPTAVTWRSESLKICCHGIVMQ